MKKSKNSFDLEKVKLLVKNNLSIAGVLRGLELKPEGGNYRRIKKFLEENKIDISHFTGAAWNQGSRYRFFGKKYELRDILVKNSPYKSTNSLKIRLFSEGIKIKKCEICGNSMWRGKELSLELHHINGDPFDNRIENLQILCPNCHSITENYRGKNTKKDNLETNKKEIEREKKINEINTKYLQEKKDKVKTKKAQKEKICPECGKIFTGKNVYCSLECYNRSRSKSKRPDIISLCKKYKELSGNLTHLGKFYGVSDNTVKKWLILYGIYKNIPDL